MALQIIPVYARFLLLTFVLIVTGILSGYFSRRLSRCAHRPTSRRGIATKGQVSRNTELRAPL
ncbi:hypothetical protein K443DRAFT_664977, partial [Laccaria amethystina LaAM-08-1]